ncbi:MAG TPA: hypothetical protein DIT07_13220, partial [Sphingobacteriaceae bacterium]|nr:hypothetical protein [Sphingobacteriaceae bacterium]
MRLFLIVFVFCSVSVVAQDVDPFGQRLMDWVTTQAGKDSRRLCEADYPDRIQKTMMICYDNIYHDIGQLDSVLSILYNHMLSKEQSFAGKDSLWVAIERSEDARSINLLLLSLEGKITEIISLYQTMDSLAGRQYYTYYGLTHVGRESLIESYTELGNSLASTFNLKYDNYFYISVGNDGSASVQSNKGNTGMFATVGMAVGAEICGPWCAAGGLVIGFAVGWFTDNAKQKAMQEEIQRQKGILKAAIDLLPSKLLDGEQMYAIYKSSYDTVKLQFDSLKLQADTLLKNLFNSWKPLYLWNSQRMGISSLQLSTEKIKYLQQQYKGDVSLQRIFDTNFQQQVIGDAGSEMGKLTSEKYAIINSPNFDLRTVERLEDYQDECYFFKTILQNLLQDKQLIPNYPFLNEKLETINEEINAIPAYRLQLKKKTVAQSVAFEYMLPDLIYVKYEGSFSKNRNSRKTYYDGGIGFSVCAEGANYRYCWGGDNSYRNRVGGDGNSPINNIYGSSHDGGIKEFNASAARQVDGMRQNIQVREDRLRHDYQSMKSALTNQVTDILPRYDVVNASLEQTQALGHMQSDIFYNANSAGLQQYKSQMDNFVQAGYGQYSAQHFQNEMDLQDEIYNQVPEGHTAGTDIKIAGTRFSSQRSQNLSSEMNAFTRELSKQKAASLKIDKRATDNFKEQKPDPVFKNKNAYDQYNNRLAATTKLIDELSTRSSTAYFGSVRNKDLIDYYTQQIKIGRLYGSNELPPNQKIFQNFPFLDNSKTNTIQNLVNSYKACQDAGCQVSISAATFALTNDQWFYNNRRPDGSFDRPSDMLKRVSQSSDWNFVGYSNTQKVINQASSMATLGYTVIAFNTDGFSTEAGIILPGMPYQNNSGNWNNLSQPNVVYFSEKKPASSGFNRPLSVVSGDPGRIVFYAKPPVVHYKNVAITDIAKTAISTGTRYEPGVGALQVPQLQLTIGYRDNAGADQSVQCNINLTGAYVHNIQNDFGSQAGQICQYIFNNRDALFGPSHIAAPAGLSASQQQALVSIESCMDRLDQAYKVDQHPEYLYYTQALHELYSSCVNDIAIGGSGAGIDAEIQSAANIASTLETIVKTTLNVATALTPGINDARDWFELITGTDMITGEKLETWERVLTGAAVIAGSGVLFRDAI